MFQPFIYSIFPELFSYSEVVISILRILVGYLWLKHSLKIAHRLSSSSLGLVSILLIVGGLTQLTAALLAFIGFYCWQTKNMDSDYWFLLSILTLSLFFLGPGAIGIDLRI